MKDVSFAIREGEIVGVAGVAGNGQRELAEAVSGMRDIRAGGVRIAGRRLRGGDPREAIRAGVGHVPEDRLGTGLAPSLSVTSNVVIKTYRRRSLSRGPLLALRRMREAAMGIIRGYDVKDPGPGTPVRNLSGGNLQKLVLGREFEDDPLVLVVAQPTRGLDVGAFETVHSYLRDAAARGVAILLMSEDLDEILALADRILVVYEGEIVGELRREPRRSRKSGCSWREAQPMKLERRLEQPWWLSVAVPLGSLVVAFGMMAVILAATGHDPVETYREILDAAFTGNGAFSATFISATPILFTGLAAAAAFRMQLFNIGAEGQLYLGAVGASWIALQLGDRSATSTPLYVVAMCVAAGLAGALWALIPGVLKAFARTNEIITSLMLNYVAGLLLTYLIFDSSSYWRDTSTLQARAFPQGKPMPEASNWPTFGSEVVVPLGFVIGLATALALWVLYTRMRFGFEVAVIADRHVPRAMRVCGPSAEDPVGDGGIGCDRRDRGREPDRRLHVHARWQHDRPASGRLRLHGDRRRGAGPVQPARGLPRRGAHRRAPERGLHAAGPRLSLGARRRDAGSSSSARSVVSFSFATGCGSGVRRARTADRAGRGAGTVNDTLLVVVLADAVLYGTPLLFASLGELLAERSGVLNLGVEGMMLFGAVVGFWITQRVEGASALVLVLAILVSGLAGAAWLRSRLPHDHAAREPDRLGLALTIFAGGLGLSAYVGTELGFSPDTPAKQQFRSLDVGGSRIFRFSGRSCSTSPRSCTRRGSPRFSSVSTSDGRASA